MSIIITFINRVVKLINAITKKSAKRFKSRLKEDYFSIVAWTRKNKILLFSVLGLIIFYQLFPKISLLIGFYIAIQVGNIYRRFVPVYLGMELTFYVIMCVTLGMGLTAGIIYNTLVYTIAAFVRNRLTLSTITNWLAVGISITIAHYLKTLGVVTLISSLIIVKGVLEFIFDYLQGDPNTFINIPGHIIAIFMNQIYAKTSAVWLVGLLQG